MSSNITRLSAVVLLFLGLVCPPLPGQKAAAPAKPKTTFDKAAFEAYLRHLFIWTPEVKVVIDDPQPSSVPGLREVVATASSQGASVQQRLLLSADGKKIVQGAVYDLADNPFRPELSKLTTDSAPAMGTAGAPVVLALFTDFQCPYCRDEAKMLRQNLPAKYPTQVRLYLKEFPLDQIHPWARQAAIAGRCIYRQSPDVFWLYHDWVFEQQAQITAQNFQSKVSELVKTQQVDPLQLGRCLQNKETEAEVNKSVAEGIALQVNGTPALFVNGRRISPQLTWPQLSTIIDLEIQYQKTANNAGDLACCKVTLTSPLSK
jgi:protein-disulfide isomerase